MSENDRIDDNFKQRIFLTLNNVSKSMESLKEDTLIRLFRAENKIKELESKIKQLEHKNRGYSTEFGPRY